MNKGDSAWLGVLLAAFALLVIALPYAYGDPLTDLSGRWPAVVSSEERTIAVPGDFADQAIQSDAEIQIAIPVQTHEASPQMLYVERAGFAARVLWDGKPIGEFADIDDPDARRVGGLLVPLPQQADGALHDLVIDVRGAHGTGGISGTIAIGEASAVLAAARRQEALWMGFVLTFAAIALAQSATALRRRRQTREFLGIFTALAAVLALSASGMGGVFSSAYAYLKIDAVAHIGLPSLFVGLSSRFHNPLPRQRALGLAAATVALQILTLVVPADVLPATRLPLNLWIVILTGGGLVLAWQALMSGRNGATIYFASALALTFGFVAEVLGRPNALMPALAVFIVVATIAVQVREAARAERDELLIRETPDAVLGIDQLGRLREMNPTAQRMLLRPKPVQNLLERVPSEEHPAVRAHLARAASSPDRTEFHIQTGDVSHAVESFGTPLGDGRSVLVLRDITRRRKLDEGLLHAARMETVAVLVGGIAHDFNNMLGTLLAHVGFMREVVENERLAVRLEKMESTIERASLLTRRLLTVSRGTQSDLIQVNFGRVAHSAVELVAPTLPRGIVLDVHIPEDLSPVLASESDLEHVIVNLLVNARDALGTDGHIRMVLRDFELDTGARGAFLMVEDDGPGVPADLKDDIFNPFFTTKGPNRGTGLGLAVASQILRDHHGRIWLEDRPGRGARFCLALRHADTMDEAPAPLPENRRVLLVEDEPVLLDSYASALVEAGYEVTACNAGGEAWRILTQDRPDILVTDVVMPGISGLELATLCDELHEGVPVLLVSGFIPQESLQGLTNVQWTRLGKPVRTARLVATVGRLCRRAERANRGELDITQVTWLFPPLESLAAEDLLQESGAQVD